MKALNISEAYAYELMKISIVIASNFSDLDYEDIWKLAKRIYNKWACDTSKPPYSQEYAQQYCDETCCNPVKNTVLL